MGRNWRLLPAALGAWFHCCCAGEESGDSHNERNSTNGLGSSLHSCMYKSIDINKGKNVSVWRETEQQTSPKHSMFMYFHFFDITVNATVYYTIPWIILSLWTRYLLCERRTRDSRPTVLNLIGHSDIQNLTPNYTPTLLRDSDMMDVRTDSCVAALKHQKQCREDMKTHFSELVWVGCIVEHWNLPREHQLPVTSNQKRWYMKRWQIWLIYELHNWFMICNFGFWIYFYTCD